MKKFLAFFVFVASLFASAHTADLLSESDVKVFISRNQRAIDEIKRTQEIHLGYAVAEFAKNQIMAQSHFRGGASEIVDQVIEGKVNGFKKIILSVLKGIGVGGLSKSNRKATSREHMAGYLALYTVGINSEVATPLGISSVLSTPHKKHLEICNGIIRSAHAIRENNEGARTFLSTLFTNAARKLEVKPERHPDQFGGWILEPGKPMRSAEITKLPIPQRDKEYAQRYDVRMLDLGGTVDQRYRRLGATLSFEQAVNGFFVKGVYPNIREDLAIVRSVRSGRTELTARGQRALETCFEYSIDSLAQGGEIVVLSADQEMSGLAPMLISYKRLLRDFIPGSIRPLFSINGLTYEDLVIFIANENDFINDLPKFCAEHADFIRKIEIASKMINENCSSPGAFEYGFTVKKAVEAAAVLGAFSDTPALPLEMVGLMLTDKAADALAAMEATGGGNPLFSQLTSTVLTLQTLASALPVTIRSSMLTSLTSGGAAALRGADRDAWEKLGAIPAERAGTISKFKKVLMHGLVKEHAFSALFGNGTESDFVPQHHIQKLAEILMGTYETNKDLKADTSSLEVITDCMNFLKALNNCVGIQAVRGESELERSIRSGTDSRILSATHVRRYDEDVRAAMMRLLGTMGGFVESWRL